ncbi:MAG: hypothetical protein PHQ86_07915 [Dehalococcoidales bacterium]|nr:hypothetical protein [Dehalococcoidales bacterium]
MWQRLNTLTINASGKQEGDSPGHPDCLDCCPSASMVIIDTHHWRGLKSRLKECNEQQTYRGITQPDR